MKKIIYTLVILAFVRSLSAQWSQLNSGTTIRLESMAVTDANTVYIVGGDPPSTFVNLKTTNGGLNWFSFAGSSSGGVSVYFINANTGFLDGMTNLQMTTNAGNSWTTVYTPTDTAVFLRFHFPNANTGYGVGFVYSPSQQQILQSAAIKTTNGGLSWTRLAPPISGTNQELKDVFFTDANTGYAVGWNSTGNILIKTTNGGNNWNPIGPFLAGAEMYSIFFTDQNTGYVCGSFPIAIQKTTNAGASWFVTNQDHASDICFINANTGFALCWNGIARTNNGGVNWIYQNTTFTDLFKIMFYGNYVGYAVGENGLVVKTTNGGSVFISQINSNVPEKYSLQQNYPNPFNPTTNIRFDLPKNGSVKLVVFDALGREVATLVNEKLAPGNYQVDWDGSNYTSGVYFYTLQAGDYIATKIML